MHLRVEMTRNFDPKALARAIKSTVIDSSAVMGKTRRLVEPIPPEKEPENPAENAGLTDSWPKDRTGLKDILNLK